MSSGAPSLNAVHPSPQVPPTAPASPRRAPGLLRGVLGWWGALFFNLALLGLPVGLLMLVQAMQGVQLTQYESSPQALAQTRAALERQAAELVPPDVERKAALSFLVGREVTEGDAEAARGFLMAAGTVLPGSESTRLFQRLKVNHTDEDLADQAVRFLDPTLAYAYSRIQSGRAAGAGGATFFLVGDERDLAQTARRWLDGGETDVLAVGLAGLTVVDFGLEEPAAAAVRVGASVLKSAKAAGRLRPELQARLAADLAAAFPPTVLRAQLDAALNAPGALAEEGQAVVRALRASVTQPGFANLIVHLQDLRGAAAYTSPAGALHLIAKARQPADFARLHVIAEAGRERAVAVAKRSPADGAFLAMAPMTFRAPPEVVIAAGVILASVLLLLAATVMVLKQAVERAYHADLPPVRMITPRVGRSKALPKPASERVQPVS